MAPVEELRARLDELAGRIVEPDAAPVDELRSRLDELAGSIREPDMAPVEELRARVEELARVVEQAPDASLLAELHARLDALAVRVAEPDTAPLDELRSRFDELAANVVEPDPAPLEGLRVTVEELTRRVEQDPDRSLLAELGGRLDELARRVDEPDTAPLDQMRATVEELAVAAARRETVAAFESRVSDLEKLAPQMPAKELRAEVRRLAERTVVECQSLVQVLSARVDEIATTIPAEEELLELRSRVDELAARPTESHGLQERVRDLATRLESLGDLEAAVADIRASLAGLDGARAEDSAARGAQLEELVGRVDSLSGLESRLRTSLDRELAGRAEEVSSRLDGAESRLDALSALDERLAALAFELEQRPDDEALAAVAAELRAEIAVLTARPVFADPTDRLEELSRWIEHTARSGNERIDGVAGELHGRVSGLAEELGHRLDELGQRANGLVGREEAAVAAAEHAAWVRSELGALREWAAAQATAVDVVVAEADRARVTGQQQLGHRLDEAVAAIRSDLDAHGTTLAGNANETAALHARVEELHQAVSDRAAWQSRLEMRSTSAWTTSPRGAWTRWRRRVMNLSRLCWPFETRRARSEHASTSFKACATASGRHRVPAMSGWPSASRYW